ncbi:MAG: DUF86 domain-containing protein [Cyanobacteria bacterium J06592_8]
MTIEPTVVFTRLTVISEYLRELKRFESMSLEEYLEQFDQKIISERLLELIIQAALDINEHILKQGFKVEVSTNKESFLKSGECGILTLQLAGELAQSGGLRNILAHQYLNIDHTLLFGHVQKALKQYPLYIQQVTTYLDSLEVNNG